MRLIKTLNDEPKALLATILKKKCAKALAENEMYNIKIPRRLLNDNISGVAS